MLTMLGQIDNMKLTKKPSFADWVIGMHIRCEATNGWDNVAYEKAVRQDMVYVSKLPETQVTSLWQLSKRRGEYWTLIEKIVKGEFEKPPKGIKCNNKQPSSASNLSTL